MPARTNRGPAASIDNALSLAVALLASFLIFSLPAPRAAAHAIAVDSAPEAVEYFAGKVVTIQIDHRVRQQSFTYRELRLADGSALAVRGDAAEGLANGTTVRLAARRDGNALKAVSAEVLAQSAATASPVELEGVLAIAHADDFATGHSHYHYHVRNDAGGMTTLNVASLPWDLHGGSRVHVFGRRGADGTSVDPETITVESEPAGSSNAPSGMVAKSGTVNNVLVILANFSDTAAPSYTAAQALQVMSSNPDSVAKFYNEVSYGGQSLNVTVTSSWVTMSSLAHTCNYFDIAPAANAAALALSSAYNAANYNFVVYLFPGQSCGWAGLAYVGYPHQAFINGTGAFYTQVVTHEMGHNFGLLHAGSLNCGSATIGGSCSVAEYGDPWDTMGNQRAMHFNAMQKLGLGWIAAGSVKTHNSGSASYTLSPLENAGAGTYAVQIPTSNSSRTYWIEFRQPIGFDAPLSAYPNNGVQVRVSDPFEWSSGSDDTEILDMTPGSAGGFGDSALVMGQSYLDSTYGVNIIVTGASASAATVSVTKSGGGAATTTLGSSANPSTAGTTVTFTATVTGAAPTGTVSFKDGAASMAGCSAVALGGSGNSRTAACATSTLSGGTHSIVASYSGDASNAASDSAALSQTVNKKASTTGVATSATPSAAGASVTFTATVNGSSPTGTVNFTDGAASISGCSAVALSGSGNTRTAACSTSGLAVGSHSITAAYAGDGSNNASTSTALAQTVTSGGAPTSLVNAGFESPALAAGTYQYNPTGAGLGWTFAGGSGVQRNGSAWSASGAPQGVQTAFIQSTGMLTQSITLSAGTYTLSFMAARRGCCVAPYLQPIKVLLDGVQVGGLISPASTSFAAFSVVFPVAAGGTHTIGFAGTDASDKTTFLDGVTLISGTVSAAGTSVVSSLNPAKVSASVTFTATVTGSNPTGQVAFTKSGSTITGCGSVALSGSGNTKTAVCTTNFANKGDYAIVASYGGDANNAKAASAPLTQSVRRR